MRKYATGMTAPIQLPFDDADPIWDLAQRPGWGDDDAIPGYPGGGEDVDRSAAPRSGSRVDLRVTDVSDVQAPARSPWLDPMPFESGRFLG
jgi:hypothetical protein